MNKSKIEELSAPKPQPDSEQKAQDYSFSPDIANANVSGLPFVTPTLLQNQKLIIQAFVKKLKNRVTNQETQSYGDTMCFFFSYEDSAFLLVSSSNNTLVRNGLMVTEAHYDENLNYIGYSTNSLLPKHIDFKNLSVDEFLKYLK